MYVHYDYDFANQISTVAHCQSNFYSGTLSSLNNLFKK